MKEWFKENWVRLLGWGLVVIGAVILIVTGVKAETVSNGVILVDGIIIAIGTLIAFISGTLKKKE